MSGDSINAIGQTGSANYSASDINAGTAALIATQGGFFNALGYDYNFLDGQATIEKATLNVSLNKTSHSRLKYNTDPDYRLVFNGFKLGDDANVIDVDPMALSNADFSSPVGLYNIFLSGGMDNNYEFSFPSLAGTLEVKPIKLPETVEKVANSVKTTVLSKVKTKIESKVNEAKNGDIKLNLNFDYKEYRKEKEQGYKSISIMGGLVEISPEVAEILGIKEDSLFYQQIK